MIDGSSWVELRYSATQALPEPDGIRDELDAITYWHVDAVRVSDDHTDAVIGQGAVAVFELANRVGLLAAATAYGGPVLQGARTLLDDDGRLRTHLGDGSVDRVLLFMGVTIDISGRSRGLGLAAAGAIRERLGSPRSLIACFPEPPTQHPSEPAFFEGVPEVIRQAWWVRGLAHLEHGLWVLPPATSAVPLPHGA